MFLPCLQVFNLFQIQCLTPTYTLSSLFSILLWYSLSPGPESKRSKKGLRAKAALSSHSCPSMWGQSRSLPTLCSYTPILAVQTLHAATRLSQVITLGLCSPHRSSFCLCTRMCTHVLPRTLTGAPLGMQLGSTLIHSASQQIALHVVSGITLGFGYMRSQIEKVPSLLAQAFH